MAEDYYKTLGVSRNASQADIQKAYRELARKYHPDMNPDDKSATKKFQQIQRAFDVLNNPEKREMYDRYGSSFETMGGRAAHGGPGPGGARRGRVSCRTRRIHRRRRRFQPVLRRAIRRRGRRRAGATCSPIFAAAAGARGGGAAPPPRRRYRRRTRNPLHHLDHRRRSATGRPAPVGKTETLMVKIPAGIEDGKKIRVRGQGEPAPRQGTPGDILITIHVRAASLFFPAGKPPLRPRPVDAWARRPRGPRSICPRPPAPSP